MKKLVFWLLIFFSGLSAQGDEGGRKTYINSDGTLKEKFTIGKNFDIVVPVSSAYKDSLFSGSAFYFDLERHTFIPVKAKAGAYLRWNKAGTILTAGDSLISGSTDSAKYARWLYSHDTLFSAWNFEKRLPPGNTGQYLRGDKIWVTFPSFALVTYVDNKVDLEAQTRGDEDEVLSSSITQTSEAISTEVADRINADNGLSSNITQTANSLTTEINDRQNGDNILSSRVTQTESSITSEVTNRINADNTLSSSITQTANDIQIKSSMDGTVKAGLTVGNINGGTVRIEAKNIQIDGSTTFASGYNPSLKVNSGGAAADINNNTTTVNGSKITTGTITALGNVTAGSFNLGSGRFQVDENGYLTASGVNLTGSFTVGTNTISQGAGSGEISFNNAQLWYCSWKGENLNISQINSLQSTLDQKASVSLLNGKVSISSLHLSGEGAPSGSPSNENMTYYDSDNGHYYVNFGTGSWVRVQLQ